MAARFDLLQLVRALSPQEKAQVRQYFSDRRSKCAPKAGPNHEPLLMEQFFDDLLDFEEMDEASFLAGHVHRAYMRNLEFRKNHLFDRILEVCLGVAASRPDEAIRDLLNKARFLRGREMVVPALKRLAQAEKLARRYEKHELLLDVLRLRRTLLLSRRESPPAEVLDVLDELRKVGLIVANKYELLHIKDRLYLASKRCPVGKGVAPPEEFAGVPQLPVMQSPALSFDGRHSQLYGLALYCQVHEDPDSAMDFHQQIFELWCAQPDIRHDRAEDFNNVLGNYLAKCINRERYELLAAAIVLLEGAQHRTPAARVDALQISLYTQLSHAMGVVRWDLAQEAKAHYLRDRKAIEKQIPASRCMTFYMYFAWLAFVLEDYKEAYHWVEQSIALGDHTGARLDLLDFAHLFLPLIHLVRDSTRDLVANAATSARRRLRKQKGCNHLAKEWLQYLAKYPPADEPSAAEAMHLRLTQLQSEGAGGSPLGMQVLLSWLQSRARGLSVRDVLEEERLRRG